ncbi:MAG: transglutaminaseTgpA domain-containing protein, partial [Chloroflexota bacterium]
ISSPLVEAQAVASSLGLQSTSGGHGALNQVRAGGLPRNHLLGSGPELSEQVVMTITTNDPPTDTPPGYYWRSITYDRYNGRGWLTSETEAISYAANEPVPTVFDGVKESDSSTPRLLQQTVEMENRLGRLLHVAGEVVTVDQAFSIAWRENRDLFGVIIDDQEDDESYTYQAQSLLSTPTADQLRAAEGTYPEAIRRHYLDLPDTIPDRVIALAHDLTATEPTPYDQAKTIEQYLRTFPYTLDLPAPPPNRDIADYFLFDLQTGYCDYYATSMVVLARAAGLPARLAVGYIHGSYEVETGRYVVTEAEAHSWVEIYFPDYGWVNFEPTGGRPAIDRVPTSLADASPTPDLPLSAETTFGFRLVFFWQIVLGGTVLLFVAVIGWLRYDTQRLLHLPPATAVQILHNRLRRYGQQLIIPTQAGDTPYEYATLLNDQLVELTKTGRGATVILPAIPAIEALTDLYVRVTYSQRIPDPTEMKQLIQAWPQLRWRLSIARFFRWYWVS